MILVTGATGHLGTAVIQTLLEKTSANQIAALVRDESKASALKEKGVDIRVGSYDDPASLDKAMQGIETVLLIAGTDEGTRLRQHRNIVDAAKKAGVQCIAYTSRSLKDRNTLVNKLMEGHFQTEDCIEASGLNYVLFCNVLYMDAIPQFVGERVLDTGIYFPTGQGRVPFALRSEMGEAIAHVLLLGSKTCIASRRVESSFQFIEPIRQSRVFSVRPSCLEWIRVD
jgi:NAD(P)H dehydrogenase (quinone)